jgi:hypothetical protein
MPKPIVERGRLLVEAGGAGAAPTRRKVQIITPGWGSSGYYSPEVLEQAATDKVIPAGTHMYLNHATESERHDRPERDVEKIAAVLVEDATWDGKSLSSAADLMGPHAELIESLAPYIGVSISGSATDIVVGEAEGRTGPIIEGLAHVSSVDFVTHAGRGGMLLLESARPSLVNAKAIGHGLAEATVNDTRDQLQNLLRDAYGAEKTYVWVRDFDETMVWFEVEDTEGSGVYGQAYALTDAGVVSLDGDRTEVRVQTQYVPVTRPDSNTPTATESKEDDMGKIQIEESAHTELLEKAGRVDGLVTENADLKAENEQLKEADAHRTRVDRARELIAESDTEFSPLEVRGLLADLPVKEGALDEEAFTTRVTEAAEHAASKKSGGSGITGFGASAAQSGAVSESGQRTKSPWGRDLHAVKGA